MSQPAQEMNGERIRALYYALLAGACGVTVVFITLFWLGTAPLLREDPATTQIIAMVIAGTALIVFVAAFFWARPHVPVRSRETPVASYWRSEAGQRALLVWVLFEGGTMMSAVGTLLTGMLYPEVTLALGLALYVLHSPTYFEERGS